MNDRWDEDDDRFSGQCSTCGQTYQPSLRTLLGAIHARLNQPDTRGGLRRSAVLTILDEIEAEIPELARLRRRR